ncbi:hypothetical protein CAOG_05803 [Capsaspora owczarzaki ATCC 30864]|uniref:TPX2 central domain-containing protein n=1 Tax=Capsaspora owczarzaki (strain ATCC 30864) TaxID=595528 RepID=A0A0D2WU45_CAPO3|nr:hypothetical protein CAOG_05803 [Capsaspora owczarzaki ATCC 30864]KJE95348.1 hypothetical protein CAOG_005803 [Capsaspora owczarzaki ATCC 30864]|eukprot:XP_004345393.1 hypothetical protein CAOG_05803 [Capsaspora owczarzaki ATCC 30864]
MENEAPQQQQQQPQEPAQPVLALDLSICDFAADEAAAASGDMDFMWDCDAPGFTDFTSEQEAAADGADSWFDKLTAANAEAGGRPKTSSAHKRSAAPRSFIENGRGTAANEASIESSPLADVPAIPSTTTATTTTAATARGVLNAQLVPMHLRQLATEPMMVDASLPPATPAARRGAPGLPPGSVRAAAASHQPIVQSTPSYARPLTRPQQPGTAAAAAAGQSRIAQYPRPTVNAPASTIRNPTIATSSARPLLTVPITPSFGRPRGAPAAAAAPAATPAYARQQTTAHNQARGLFPPSTPASNNNSNGRSQYPSATPASVRRARLQTEPHITVPITPEFVRRERARVSARQGLSSEDLELQRIMREREELQRARQASRSALTRSLNGLSSYMPVRSTVPLTEPQEFQFSTSTRSRSRSSSVSSSSSANTSVMEDSVATTVRGMNRSRSGSVSSATGAGAMTSLPRFAMPTASVAARNGNSSAPARAPSAAPASSRVTQPVPFQFASSSRGTRASDLTTIPQQNHAAARPSNPQVRSVQRRELTVPISPKLSKSHRSRREPALSSEERQLQEIEAAREKMRARATSAPTHASTSSRQVAVVRRELTVPQSPMLSTRFRNTDRQRNVPAESESHRLPAPVPAIRRQQAPAVSRPVERSEPRITVPQSPMFASRALQMARQQRQESTATSAPIPASVSRRTSARPSMPRSAFSRAIQEAAAAAASAPVESDMPTVDHAEPEEEQAACRADCSFEGEDAELSRLPQTPLSTGLSCTSRPDLEENGWQERLATQRHDRIPFSVVASNASIVVPFPSTKSPFLSRSNSLCVQSELNDVSALQGEMADDDDDSVVRPSAQRPSAQHWDQVVC